MPEETGNICDRVSDYCKAILASDLDATFVLLALIFPVKVFFLDVLIPTMLFLSCYGTF